MARHEPDDITPERHPEPEDAEMTDAQKDAAARRALRFLNVLLLLLGGGIAAVSLYGTTFLLGNVAERLMYGTGAVGGLIVFFTTLGLLGSFGSSHLLLIYFTFLIVASFGMLVLSGSCFIFAPYANSYVRENWDYLLAVVPADQRPLYDLERVLGFLTFGLLGLGGAAVLVLILLLSAMASVVRLVTPVKAFTLLLQATGTTLVPVGVALVAVAAYAADTAVGADAAFAAFSIFILGMFVLTVLMVGCLGTTLRSRGIIKLFMLITAVLCLLFAAFGAASLVISPRVAAAMVQQWESLRTLLPSTMAGKYDRSQFAAFVSNNIIALGFLACCTAALLATQVLGSTKLRKGLRAEAEFEAEAAEALAAGLITKEEATVLAKLRPTTLPERAWKRAWSKGTKASRCCVRLCCCVIVLVILVTVGTATSALYYTTSCRTLGSYLALSPIPAPATTSSSSSSSSSSTAAATDLGPGIFVVNNYTRGSVVLAVDSRPLSSGPPSSAQAGVNGSSVPTTTLTVYGDGGRSGGCTSCAVVSVGTSTTVSAGSGASLTLPAAGTALSMQKSAYRSDMAVDGWPVLQNKTIRPGYDVFGDGRGSSTSASMPGAPLVGLVAVEKAPYKLFNVDASCQAADITVTLPKAPPAPVSGGPAPLQPPLVVEVASGSPYVGLQADWTAVAAADRPRLRRVEARTAGGPITLKAVKLGAKGAYLSADDGSVSVADSDAACDPQDVGGVVGRGGLVLSSARGGALLTSSTVRDCDVTMVGDAALTRISGSTLTNALGGGRVALSSGSGALQVESSVVQVLALAAADGAVTVTNVTAAVSIRASTLAGAVSLQSLSLAARAGVQVDTDTGAITIHARQFAGIVSIVTGGSIACSGTGWDDYNSARPNADPCAAAISKGEAGSDGTPLNVVEQLTVNCRGTGDCPYLGGIAVTSAHGSVTLRMDRWVR